MKYYIYTFCLLFLISCSNNDNVNTLSGYDNFKILIGGFNENQNLDSIILFKLGTTYRIADFQDLKKIISIEDWASDLKLNPDSLYIVTYNGERFTKNRQYFIKVLNHYVPDNFLLHDQLDSNFIGLGSWYNLDANILCVKK